MDDGNPEMTLLATALEELLSRLETEPVEPTTWSAVRAALAHHGVGEDDDFELALAVETEDAPALRALVSGWRDGSRLLLERDRDVLKRALKAFRKRLKLTLLDAESSVAGGPMSAGRESAIVGIVPPERYPRAVWDRLVAQGRLVADGRGTYELPPGG